METVVVIVGGGPAGLAISACLNHLLVPNIILEREDCYASLWKKNSYDRLHLHLAKEFCSLPHMPHHESTPTFMPKKYFLEYLDKYVSKFNISPLYHRLVTSAKFDEATNKWSVKATNTLSGNVELYNAMFLVVATGENGDGFITRFPGLQDFKGEIIHSKEYKNGVKYQNKKVLVIGCGNSGMEIAYDLSTFNADTSIVIRNPVHVVTEEMIHLGMSLLKYLPTKKVDDMITKMADLKYGDLSKFGIHRPIEGVFSMKATKRRSPVLDMGTIKMIKEGNIKVFGGISFVKENSVLFEDGVEEPFDVLLFATGYKSTTNKWLKDYSYIMNEDGMPKNKYPSHWKGQNRLYCAGFSGMALAGTSRDAMAIADDIKKSLGCKKIYNKL